MCRSGLDLGSEGLKSRLGLAKKGLRDIHGIDTGDSGHFQNAAPIWTY